MSKKSSSSEITRKLGTALAVTGAATVGMATSAHAVLTVTNLNQSFTGLDDNEVRIDLNNDGQDDFVFFGEVDEDDNLISAGISVQIDNTFEGSIFVEPFGDIFLEQDPDVQTFEIGDTVGGGKVLFDELSFFGSFYDGESGPFAVTGTNAYIGLSLIDFETEERTFGWAEITRGSLTVGRVGFEDSGAGALITAVPVPASLGLLATGYAGLMAMRRRKRAKGKAAKAA